MEVSGVWNNYEGLTFSGSAFDYTNSTLDALLAAHGYSTLLTGKMDRTVDGHSLTDRLESLTHNVDVPYNISAYGGWNCEADLCSSQGSVRPGGTGGPNGSAWLGDWDVVKEATDYIKGH